MHLGMRSPAQQQLRPGLKQNTRETRCPLFEWDCPNHRKHGSLASVGNFLNSIDRGFPTAVERFWTVPFFMNEQRFLFHTRTVK